MSAFHKCGLSALIGMGQCSSRIVHCKPMILAQMHGEWVFLTLVVRTRGFAGGTGPLCWGKSTKSATLPGY